MKYMLAALALVMTLGLAMPDTADAGNYDWKAWTVKERLSDQTTIRHHFKTADVHGAVNVLYYDDGRYQHVMTVSEFKGKPFPRWTAGYTKRPPLPRTLMRYYFN